jgi:hypothetical protein
MPRGCRTHLPRSHKLQKSGPEFWPPSRGTVDRLFLYKPSPPIKIAEAEHIEWVHAAQQGLPRLRAQRTSLGVLLLRDVF